MTNGRACGITPGSREELVIETVARHLLDLSRRGVRLSRAVRRATTDTIETLLEAIHPHPGDDPGEEDWHGLDAERLHDRGRRPRRFARKEPGRTGQVERNPLAHAHHPCLPEAPMRVLRRVELWPGSNVPVDVLDRPLSTLEPDEVFVFGCNRAGFHGAGSAGVACRGDGGPGWRDDPRFRAMMAAPAGSESRIGRWAVFGVGRGHQIGREGQSYAIETIERPGYRSRRGVSLGAIGDQLHDLVEFARGRPHLRFVVTPVGEGFAGYTRAEMSSVWRGVDARCGGIPASFRFIRIGE